MGLLDGKTAIITGSARGIGRATAELFAAEGAQVTINDIDGDVAEQAAGEIKGETSRVGGPTKPGACDEVVKKAIDAFGKVDILVNNAGYTWDGVAHKMRDEQFQAMLDIHTVVPFRMARAVAPHMREPAKAERDRGQEVFRKIINITSVSGTMGNAGQVNYSSGKAGVTASRRRSPRNGASSSQRQRDRVRVRGDAPHPGEGEGRDDQGRRGRARSRDRSPGADAQHGGDDHPTGAAPLSPKRPPPRCSSWRRRSPTTSTARSST